MNEKLNKKQEFAIELVLEGMTDSQIAQWVGVSRQRVNIWRNQDVEFMQTLQQRRRVLRAVLPMLLGKEVHGLGFALSCDFLKEIGYTDYPKPDVHLVDIFFGLNICNREEYEVYKAIIRMAEASNRSAYCVDKCIWLICSGKFYLDNIEITGRKKEFIKTCKDEVK